MVNNKLSLILSLVLLLIVVRASASENIDNRITIKLDPSERHLVLGEMRVFLASVQQILDGVSSKDVKKISASAKKLGMAAAQSVPTSLAKKLPEEFRKLAFDTHMKFDEIARDAEDLEDTDHSLSQVTVLMKNCVSCHAIYQITTTK